MAGVRPAWETIHEIHSQHHSKPSIHLWYFFFLWSNKKNRPPLWKTSLILLFLHPFIVIHFCWWHYLPYHCFPAGSSRYICGVHKKRWPSAISGEGGIVGLDHVGFPEGNIGLYQLLLFNLGCKGMEAMMETAQVSKAFLAIWRPGM